MTTNHRKGTVMTIVRRVISKIIRHRRRPRIWGNRVVRAGNDWGIYFP